MVSTISISTLGHGRPISAACCIRLTGSNDWVDLNGTVHVRKVWNGRAQLEEIEADGSTEHLEGLTLFLYNPQAHQWGQYFVDSADGVVNPPQIGEFKNGRGELLRPGIVQRADYLCAIRLVGHYS